MIEQRDNGDLVIFASNDDPLVKFQADGFIAINTNPLAGDEYLNHPLNSRAEGLDTETVEAIAAWCDLVLTRLAAAAPRNELGAAAPRGAIQ